MKWIVALAVALWALAALTLNGPGQAPLLARPVAKGERDPSRPPLWERVMSDRRERIDRLLREADALLGKRRFQQALSLLQGATTKNPHAPPLWFALGTIHSYSEQYGDCAKALETCRRLDPHYQPSLLAFRLGLCLSLSGRIAEGIREYQKATVTAQVGGEVLHWNLGDSHMALGRLEEAVSHYEAALRLNPARQVLHFALAVALDRQGQWEAASRRMSYALQLDPTGSSLSSGDILWLPAYDHHYYRALLHLVRGQRAQALGHYQKFFQAAPRSPWRFVMRLRAEGLRTQPLVAQELQARHGPLDPAKAAALLVGKHPALRRCLGTAPETWTLPELKGVAVTVNLQQGRPTGVKVNVTAGEVPVTASACLQRALAPIRWAGALRGRDSAGFTVEIVGP